MKKKHGSANKGSKKQIVNDNLGSLGLLALGHKGLRKWRKDRLKSDQSAEQKKDE